MVADLHLTGKCMWMLNKIRSDLVDLFSQKFASGYFGLSAKFAAQKRIPQWVTSQKANLNFQV